MKPTNKILHREQKIKKYTNIPPHRIFQEPQSIKWFRTHFNDNLVKKSVYSLFPNNCEPMLIEEEVTKMSILMEWLSHYLKPKDRYKDLWINPKYFFRQNIYDKLLKLKEIFLEFDEDGSRKMEIDEMVSMFKVNHINVTEDDLISLFFKGKKFRKCDINKLYLDFYQFMQFGLSKKVITISGHSLGISRKKLSLEKAQMQMIEKNNEQQQKCNNEKIENDNKDKEENLDELFKDNTSDELVFLPMNFNLVLDYFIKKGKERKSQKKIRKTIKTMKNIISPVILRMIKTFYQRKIKMKIMIIIIMMLM